ncbi:MAG: DUF1800 domain-containing protein [Phaeodactylibacter sp.]|nr:DUF1800 domain-containing protein [Phaeodactylibacter sp.]
MLTTVNCATGTLAPYVPSVDVPWNKQRVMHLYRRMGFGATPAMIEAALQMSPSDLADSIIDEAAALPPSPEPEWASWIIDDYENFNEQSQEQYVSWMLHWLNAMLTNGFRERLALFWSNHFVTKYESYVCPSHLYLYHKLLQQHALGNFRQFTYDIGKTPAMLIFLNGVQNTVLEPNENYARELYELFTLGQDNGYTQQDIVETARALTGWNDPLPLCGPVNYVVFLHDNGQKTIFGQTGNWGYDDVHNLLFTQRDEQVAHHICTKIYRYFVHPEVDTEIVAGLAQTFLDNNFELAPVFRQLFKSEHFFDPYVISTEVKSPVEHFLGFINEGNFPYNDDVLTIIGYLAYDLGQQLFSPVDVAGWPGNRSWVDSSSLVGRWQGMDYFLFLLYQNAPTVLVQLAKDLSGLSTDPAEVAQAFIDHFLPNGMDTAEAYERATIVFKWEVPQNYYDNGWWNLDWETAPIQVVFLLRHIVRLPEFQLA